MEIYRSNKDAKDYTCQILPEEYNEADMKFKIIVIGDAGVGKSSLTNKAIKNDFNEKYNATIGFEFSSFNVKMDNKVINLQIWDTCGQEFFRSLITNFYRNSSLAIMVYSIDNKDSFDSIDIWLKELRMNCNPNAKVFLIGNKCDLDETEQRRVKKEMGEEYAKAHNMQLFMETSAKTGFNAKHLFLESAKILYDDYLKHKEQIKTEVVGTFKTLAKSQPVATVHGSSQNKCNC